MECEAQMALIKFSCVQQFLHENSVDIWFVDILNVCKNDAANAIFV